MNKIAVIIPVHKTIPNDSEIKSLKQCIRLLSKHHIVLCVANNFDTSFYENLCAGKITLQIERFDDVFFRTIKGYNRLLLSIQFYDRFSDYDYIFIYHLDAFVFRDELDFWCNQGYDNIGAPWFKGFDNPEKPYVFLGSGNGGCCLRKVSSCQRVLKTFKYIQNPFKIFLNDKSFKGLIRNFTTHNNFHHRFNRIDFNEDYFFSTAIPKRFQWFKNCPPEKSLEFSFEAAPAFLYKLNNNKLPMACHAWIKYDYEFWKPFIESYFKDNNQNI